MKKKIDVSSKALNIINKNKMKPIPKWEFVVKNLGLWLAFGLCGILMIIAASVTWMGLIDNIIAPYLWIIVTLFFLILSYFLFEKTKNAYRYQKWQIGLLIIFLGVSIGGALFEIGVAKKIDMTLEKKVANYRKAVPLKLQTWTNPENGYLSGIIIKIDSNNSFEIKDYSGKKWKIIGEKVIIRDRVKMEGGEEIKLIGKMSDKNEFKVEEIRPWNGSGRMMNSR